MSSLLLLLLILTTMILQNKLLKARNLHEILAVSGDLGWRVVGASSGPNSITSSKLSESARPTILVMVSSRLYVVATTIK